MTAWWRSAASWIERRLQVKDTLGPLLRHPVPRGLGWWYVFGSSTLALFGLQVLTGVCLTLVYVRSAQGAHSSLEHMNYDVTLGWYLRAVHYWSASGMLVLMLLHMTRVFLTGAFKYPRELTWVVGVGLFALTLGMLFTGQVLRWDTDAYWGLGVGASMMGRLPWVGPGLVRFVQGGPFLDGDSLSRFFTLHVFWIPALLVGLLVVHLYLVVKLGISEWPVAGRPDRPQTYDRHYEELLARGEPFYPYDFSKDATFAGLVVLTVLVLALVFGPCGPGLAPDPAMIHTEPRPDWEFRWLFALLALSPPQIESVVMLGLPPAMIVVLLLVPFVARRGERAAERRPVAVLAVLLVFLTLGVLTYLGYAAPWSPHMTAWSGVPVPKDFVRDATPRQLQGAAVFQYKSCRNCHSLGGRGGRRGPALDSVATRLDRDELIRQVEQGGGNMPPYGKELKPAEVEALVSFLQTLRPKGAKPAESPAPADARQGG